MSELPPSLYLFMAAVITLLLPGRMRRVVAIAAPAFAFYAISQLPETGSEGSLVSLPLLPGFQDLQLLRVDGFSRIFGYIFTLNAALVMFFGWHAKGKLELSAALAYIGSALGVVFAGDLMTFYIHWELMAVFSMLVVIAPRTPEAFGAARRYFLVHVFGGLLLLAGIMMHIWGADGSQWFRHLEPELFVQSPAAWLMLAGILVNAAAPPLSSWLPDAYPTASVTGGLILSAYTTKTAVYALLRGFPGWEILIVIGCIMSVYGIIYALLENDMRRILAYSIINQVGFMVCAVGIGTPLALNGAAAHAFCHIIYKSLLWMSAGAVLYRVGKSKCTELGGLYKTMPWTMLLGTIGALAISAVPLTSGFTSKTLIIAAAEHEHLKWAWLILEAASAGVFLHAGIKFPYFVFFNKDRGLRPPEAPKSMLWAMGAMAFLCIFLGVYPQPLYDILPLPMAAYNAYTPAHIVTQIQLLVLSALVFFLFLPWLKRTDTISVDFDWFYRRGAPLVAHWFARGLNSLNEVMNRVVAEDFPRALGRNTSRGAAAALALVMVPYWRIKDFSDEEVERRLHELQEITEGGLIPVGVGAAVALLVFSLFILL